MVAGAACISPAGMYTAAGSYTATAMPPTEAGSYTASAIASASGTMPAGSAAGGESVVALSTSTETASGAASGGANAVSWKTFGKIGLSWVLTLPFAGGLAAAITAIGRMLIVS